MGRCNSYGQEHMITDRELKLYRYPLLPCCCSVCNPPASFIGFHWCHKAAVTYTEVVVALTQLLKCDAGNVHNVGLNFASLCTARQSRLGPNCAFTGGFADGRAW